MMWSTNLQQFRCLTLKWSMVAWSTVRRLPNAGTRGCPYSTQTFDWSKSFLGADYRDLTSGDRWSSAFKLFFFYWSFFSAKDRSKMNLVVLSNGRMARVYVLVQCTDQQICARFRICWNVFPFHWMSFFLRRRLGAGMLWRGSIKWTLYVL